MEDCSGFFIQPEIEDLTRTGNLTLLSESKAGYAQIWRGEKAGKFMAYKALKPEFRGQILYEKLLLKDFDIGFTLDHPNVCRYYGFCNLPGIGNAIEMEWIDGVTLDEYARESMPSRRERKRIVSEMCGALSYIHHRHVIHRDLKPANILITNNGGFVKLIDFGLSDTDSYATLKASAGTEAYAAPEMRREGAEIDSRADIWSLGKVISGFAPEYRAVARKCMEEDPDRRYGNAESVLLAIQKSPSRPLAVIGTFALIALSCATVTVSRCMSKPDGEAVAPEIPESQAIIKDTVIVAAPAPAEPHDQPESAELQSPKPVPVKKTSATKPKVMDQSGSAADEKPSPEVRNEDKTDNDRTLTQSDIDDIFRQATSIISEGTE